MILSPGLALWPHTAYTPHDHVNRTERPGAAREPRAVERKYTLSSSLLCLDFVRQSGEREMFHRRSSFRMELRMLCFHNH